jgi:hypothetical protein
VPPASPLTVLGKIAGFGLLSFGALWLLLIPFMLAEGDSGAALGGLLIGLFFAVPGALVVGLMRHHRLTSEFQNGVIGLIWSHDAFTAGELAPKIGKSEQATERLIAGLSRRAGIPLVYHAGERRYYHPSRLTRRHAVSTHCQRCGAALSREVLFEGETRRCRYCDTPAASLPPPPP